MKCVILDDYQQVALSMADWSVLKKQMDVSSISRHLEGPELIEAIKDSEIVIIMRERTPFNAAILEALPNLRLLITSGMRNASIDLEAAKKQGITVCGTRSNSEPPTELAWALILGLARSIPWENKNFREGGPWQKTVGADLFGKQIGLLGLGKIGGRMATIAKAFGMKVVAWSQNLTKEQAEKNGVELAASKNELLLTSDFISIHLVLSDRTRGLIGKEELQLMKANAYLINTSRAAIVDQEALLCALENDWIAGAGIDVFDIEPLPKDHRFRTLPNILATPHLGYVTEGNYKVYFQEALENIQAFLEGKIIREIR